MDYTIPDLPKQLRETLCVAQGGLALLFRTGRMKENDYRHHSTRLQNLINECDRHRPLGPDGKHGSRHTATCGCEDVPTFPKVSGKESLGINPLSILDYHWRDDER